MQKTHCLKSLFSKENIGYVIFAIIHLSILAANRIIVGFDNILWISDIASVFSLLYIIFNVKHMVIGLVFNVIASAILVVTGIIQHIWLNAAICLFISIPFVSIGIISWIKNKDDDSKTLKKLNKKQVIDAYCFFIILCVIFTVLLKLLGGNLYYLDAIYSMASVLGIILCSRTYIDQFPMFMVGNVAGLVMYIILTIQNINNLPLVLTIVMFQVGNIMGLLNWRKLMKQKNLITKQNDTPKNNNDLQN